MLNRKIILKTLFIFCLFPALSAYSQIIETPPDSLRKNAVRLFIDCNYCDMNYIRKEIPFVNYVRDVNEAQLYLMETMENTGSGGQKYSFFFQGQDKFAGMIDTLTYMAPPDETRDQTRNGRTKMIQMGLMRYVAKTPIYQEVQIRHNGNSEIEEEVIDKWNNWVYELETRPRFESQETLKELSMRNSININKITPKWKVEIQFDQMYTRTKYNYDGETFTNEKNLLKLENLVVKSIGNHWSIGSRSEISTSTFSNTKVNVAVMPSIEYNLFPYSESTHHQMRFLYGIGFSHFQYNDTTVYNKIRENLVQQKLQIAYQVQEKWGSVNVSLEGSNYFHDLTKNNLELSGMINIRIVKGLSLSVFGNIARIHDQLSLVRAEASEADILLQLSELATAYSVDGGVGITYTFGSIYNNVVNPRFGNGRFRFFR